MTRYQPDESITPEIPVVAEGVFGALRHDFDIDSSLDDRNYRKLIESNTELAHQIVIEAHRRSGGRPELQFQFVQGALFVVAAIQRQANANKLSELLSEPANIGIEPLEPNGGADGDASDRQP